MNLIWYYHSRAYTGWANKEKAISIISDALKPGGSFIMNCITEYSNIIIDIASHSKEYYPIFKAFDLVNKDYWISPLHKYKFEISDTKKVDDFIFDCLDYFLAFYEAATHGKFRRTMLPYEGYHLLIKKYTNEIAVFGPETLNVSAIKIQN